MRANHIFCPQEDFKQSFWVGLIKAEIVMQMKLDLRYHKKGLEIQFGLCAMFTFEYIRLSIMWREKQTF